MTPSIGQPWIPGAQELSIGDPFAGVGTDAHKGVVLTPAGIDVPPSFVISLATSATYDLTTFVRLAAAPANMLALNPIVTGFAAVSYHFQNVDTGVFLAPLAAGPVAVIEPPGPPPAGASPVFGGGLRRWYSFAALAIPTPAAGTYRLLTHLSAGAPFEAVVSVYHETYFTVTP
jgi:hypothetical protein